MNVRTRALVFLSAVTVATVPLLTGIASPANGMVLPASPVTSMKAAETPTSVPAKRNWKKLLLTPAVLGQLVQAETPLTPVLAAQGNVGSAVASYETRSVGTQTIAIVSIEVFPSGNFRTAAQNFASAQNYTTLSLTKKRWSGYVERDGYVLYMYFNNIGRNMIAEGGVAVVLPVDDARRLSAQAQARNIALSQGVKLNKAGWGTLGSYGR